MSSNNAIENIEQTSMACYIPYPDLGITFLPKLVQQILTKKQRAIILCKDLGQLKELDEYLWTFQQLAFLPHICDTDNVDLRITDATPIFLTTNKIIEQKGFDILITYLDDFSSQLNFSKILIIGKTNKQVDAIFTQQANGSWSASSLSSAI